MLSDVVVVARFLGEEARLDRRVDRGGSGIGGGEERAAVDLADVLAVDLDERVRADHLEIEDQSAWPQSVARWRP